MWRTNLKVLVVVLGTVGAYTWVANAIPQVESEVPRELTFTGEITAAELVAAGEEIYFGAGGCEACHGTGTRAPNLLSDDGGTGLIGERCHDRVPDQDCKEYLYASMVRPNEYVVPGFQPIMPDMSRTLSDAQVWSVVAYLQSLGGEVTVDASDIQADDAGAADGAGDAAAAGAAGGPLAVAADETDPVTLLREHNCIACHQLGDEGGPIGPPFDGIGDRRTAEQIRRGILEPRADTTPGYEAVAGTMPETFGQQMTAQQLEALVRFLSEQEGS